MGSLPGPPVLPDPGPVRRSVAGAGGLTLAGAVLGFLAAGPALAGAQRAALFAWRGGDTSPYKGYSGVRLFPDFATRAIYHHDQTIAVLEISPTREILNCELIEVFNIAEKHEALMNLTSISKPQRISFMDMMDLMEKCHVTPTPNPQRRNKTTSVAAPQNSPRSILSGVIPGTKWCGVGDLAQNYFDLGPEINIDKCCRTHDLCPVKVRGYTTKYNLTNASLYTKSHCECDSNFQRCLKAQSHPTADVMGNIYFNLLRVPCIEEEGTRRYFRKPKNYS